MRAKGTPQEPTIANNHVKSQIPAQSARAPPHIKAYWPYLKNIHYSMQDIGFTPENTAAEIFRV